MEIVIPTTSGYFDLLNQSVFGFMMDIASKHPVAFRSDFYENAKTLDYILGKGKIVNDTLSFYYAVGEYGAAISEIFDLWNDERTVYKFVLAPSESRFDWDLQVFRLKKGT